MHLLQAQAGAVDDGSEPVDLGQTPADILVISAADNELAALSQAHQDKGAGASLRLASLMHLQHPMSVDLHLDDCATRCGLVIARVLGGSGYWSYGLEQFAIQLAEAGVPFVVLPGDDKPDEELARFSTVPEEDRAALWAYLVEGGPENSAHFLQYAAWMLGKGEKPEAARTLLRAGVYWPGAPLGGLEVAKANWVSGGPIVPVVFYRALVLGAGLSPVNLLVQALLQKGMNPLPVFVASLKDPVSAATLEGLFEDAPPDVILNATAFATGAPDGEAQAKGASNPFCLPAARGAPVFQLVLSGGQADKWRDGTAGLSPRDIAMNVALPEVDGRVLTRAISFKDEAYFDAATQCPVATYRAEEGRIGFVADLTANWARLRSSAVGARKVALILANYPNKDGRLANGVGLDTPQSTVDVLHALNAEGYQVVGAPGDSDALMQAILSGPTNWLSDRNARAGGVRLTLRDYKDFFAGLPEVVQEAVIDRWGAPENDPFLGGDGFALSVLEFGNVVVAVQPARGYNIDPKETYHAPDLVPPHNYLAFYAWLRGPFDAHAIVHMGKHGNLEWLPGKALALSEACFPEVALGTVPNIYPFIVNDPGEGTQAKRRAAAVIIDHLTPPMTRAETYGPLQDLEALVDEYYDAAGVDPRRLNHLRADILSMSEATGLDVDAGITDAGDEDGALAKLDAYLCDIKESQIRDGLHVFGASPTDRLERDLLIALVRVPRGDGTGGNASMLRAMADDFELGFDPLDVEMATPWTGPRPEELAGLASDNWRTAGDTVERLELLAMAVLDGAVTLPAASRTAEVMAHVRAVVQPAVSRSGPSEMAGLLSALDGHFVAPGPSGAPTRGRLDVLPTGRNFFSVDTRAVPTPTAWALGWKSASLLLDRHLQDHGEWPRALLLTAWGTANMRTGGDDIAQALALMGVRPTWDQASRRVTGFEIMPAEVLGRPRVDVTFRVSGFFRDAFPYQMDIVDSAARAVMGLDEPENINPAAVAFRSEGRMARVFGSKPGAYGAGLQAMIDERLWDERSALGDAYLHWGSYVYGSGEEGALDREGLQRRLSTVDGIVQNQDNREHDVLDSDDYYQFEGGAAAAVFSLQGRDRPIYHNDHSRPERPRIQTLDEEIGRTVRARVVNPKWIEGVKRHGYKGAFEMAATLDYLFAFAATTGAVRPHHFDLTHQAFFEDPETRDFIEQHNPAALREMAERFQEAIDRGLWAPRSNSARSGIEAILKTGMGG